MNRIYILIMLTMFGCVKGYGQDDGENKKWVISMIKSYIENLSEMSEPIVFKDDFIGNQDFYYTDLEDNFTVMEPMVSAVTDKVIKQLKALIKEKLQVYFYIGYPNSVVTVDDIHGLINELLDVTNTNFKNSAVFSMKLYPKSVTFVDNTHCITTDCFVSNRLILDKYGKIGDDDLLWFEDESELSELESEVWNEENSFYTGIVVKSSKPIKSFDYDVHVPIPSTKVLRLSDEVSIANTIHGDFKLKRLSGNRVRIEVPSYLYRTVDIYGIYKDGRVLKEIEREKTNTYDAQQMANFSKWAKVYESLLEEVNTHSKYSSTDITNKITAIQMRKSKDAHKPIYVSYEIEFSGPVDHVQINVYGILDAPKIFSFTKKFSYIDNEFFLGTDVTTHKLGILGLDGQWVVKPIFSSEMTQYSKYFYYDRLDNEDDNRRYWFDRNNKQMKKMSYEFNNDTVYADRYSIVTKRDEPVLGVMNVITGEMVLPVKYSAIRIEEDKWQVEIDEQYRYFTLDGEPLENVME